MHSKNSVDVTVIILNYNSSDYTVDCVNSIIKTTNNLKYEIIIVDNNSIKDEFEKLSVLSEIKNLKIIRSRINLGFSGGNMYGFQFADKNTGYYLFLNNDCILLNDVIKILTDFMEKTPNAALCTAQMFSPDLEFRPSFTYFPDITVRLLGHLAVRFFHPQKYPSRHVGYQSPIAVPVITGSAMFIRAKYFAEIGGFDTNYFLYSEEEDICKRMSLEGYVTYLVPSAKFIHVNGGSTNYNIDVLKEFHISLFYFYRKFYKFPKVLILKLYYLLKNIRKFYKSFDYFKIGIFVLMGAPMKDSLRFKQKINFE